jgi:hypothetical protein
MEGRLDHPGTFRFISEREPKLGSSDPSSRPSDPTAVSTELAGAGAGTYPGGTSFQEFPLTGLRFGTGLDVPGDGSGDGDLELTLLGTDPQGSRS